LDGFVHGEKILSMLKNRKNHFVNFLTVFWKLDDLPCHSHSV
jgi:hypothetical protein